MSKKSAIIIDVETNENNIPEKIHWTAQDGGVSNQEAQAMILSFWDPKQKETFGIDLWTKEMPLDDMKYFIYQTLISLSDTFYRATDDQRMKDTMEDFISYYADKMNIK